MHINRCRNAVIAQGFTNRCAKRQVRYVVIVHHIEMHHIRSCGEHFGNIFAQTGKISGENGWCNEKIFHTDLVRN
ncbi:Uncharacterised protein [Vibrio cholerae]|nr:Uncharacterised protein [Vibrio cholerae]CSC03957.1 Uncharacterised protein [Vibrio cholerae]